MSLLEVGPAARFIESSVSILLVRVSGGGVILAANRQAETLIGEPLLGRAWDAMLLNFDGPPVFSRWLARPERPRLLNIRTSGGLPQTLRVTVFEEGEDYLLFGEVDSVEQARLGRDVLELNGELGNLSRELAHKNAELADVLREKEGLLRETHHRVKNNLALVTSLMRITAGRSLVPETRAVLLEMQARIHSVIALNETLYKTASYTSVHLADYLKQIATHVFQARAPKTGEVRLSLDLAPVEVATAQAIPCGLIANELMTNSLKHGFPEGRRGEVRLSLRHGPDGLTELRVADQGVGLPPDFTMKHRDSLGLQLVGDLARQLQGTLEVGPGSTFTVSFTSQLRAGQTGEIPVTRAVRSEG